MSENDFKPEYSVNFCSKCGSEVSDENDNFCPNCGNKIKVSQISADLGSEEVVKDEQSKFVIFKLIFGLVKAKEVTRENIVFGMLFCLGGTIYFGYNAFWKGMATNTPSNVTIYLFYSFFTFLFIGLSLRFVYYFLIIPKEI